MKYNFTVVISLLWAFLGNSAANANMLDSKVCRHAVRALSLGTIDIGEPRRPSGKAAPRLVFENAYYPWNEKSGAPGTFGRSHPNQVVWDIPVYGSKDKLETILKDMIAIILSSWRHLSEEREKIAHQRLAAGLSRLAKVKGSAQTSEWIELVDFSFLDDLKNSDLVLSIRKNMPYLQIRLTQVRDISESIIKDISTMAMYENAPELKGYQWSNSIPSKRAEEQPHVFLLALMRKALETLNVKENSQIVGALRHQIEDQIAEDAMREILELTSRSIAGYDRAREDLLLRIKKRWNEINNKRLRIKNIGELRDLIMGTPLQIKDWVSLGFSKYELLQKLDSLRFNETLTHIIFDTKLRLTVYLNGMSQKLTIKGSIRASGFIRQDGFSRESIKWPAHLWHHSDHYAPRVGIEVDHPTNGPVISKDKQAALVKYLSYQLFVWMNSDQLIPE